MGTFNFTDKNGNQGTVEGVNDTDYATLNDLIEAVNIIGQSSSAKNFIDSLARKNELFVLTGEIRLWTSSNIPDGFLLCNGVAVSRETYANLFSVIGTTFGAGDGSSTFNLPDMRDRYPIGAGDNAPGTYIAEQLPNITGYFYGGVAELGIELIGGAFSGIAKTVTTGTTGDSFSRSTYSGANFNAHNSNAVYTDNGKVYPASLALNFIIKA